ncbi:MAG: DUF1573 domain-containing protein [Deltaproteobacteria bacterium]|nr:DUF1573 domain-containing protein [Deltaproteobacteria bacterium]
MKIPTLYYSGKLRKTIHIITNDPNAGTIKLNVSADIKEVLVVRPRYINFGKVKQGSTYKREITLTNKGEKEISITDIVLRPEGVMSIEPTNKITLIPDQEKTFSLLFTPSDKTGQFRGAIIIKTDINYLPKKIIRVQAKPLSNHQDKHLYKD